MGGLSQKKELEKLFGKGWKNASTMKKIGVIKSFVRKERKERGIEDFPGPQEELSCLQFGEFFNLLNRQLMNTHETEWKKKCGFSGGEIIDGVYRQVLSEIYSRTR